MYNQRLKIFLSLCAVFVVVCITRLAFIQSPESRKQAIASIKAMRNVAPVQLPTLRGRILDKNGKVLAVDKPKFNIYVSYQLTRLLDERWQRWQILRLLKKGKTEAEAEQYLCEKYADEISSVYRVIDVCSKFNNVSEAQIHKKIGKINNAVWRLRTYLAWRKYRYNGGPMANFKKYLPDENKRIMIIGKERIVEMYRNYSLLELENEDDKFTAEIALSNIKKASVSAEPMRDYPFGSVGSQIIGWVKPVAGENQALIELLESDELASYQGRELAGFKGVEWVCEASLRGRRGRVEYDREDNLVAKTNTCFGNDVKLTIDIELQKQIEEMLADPSRNNKFHDKGSAAVVLDVDTGRILAIVSLPTFDLNLARTKYNQFHSDPNKPFVNRALEKIYPPGSTIKPLILIAALEEKKITPATVISCPAHKAPKGWPSCWIWRQFKGSHDYKWQNNARNAIKGSCNIYFSRIANMLDSAALQKWLYDFGYGRRILSRPNLTSVNLDESRLDELDRRLRESGGVIWTGYAKSRDVPLKKLPKLSSYEKRMFGIGQGNMRCTVLQSANEMATIARNGIYVQPELFVDSSPVQRDLGISSKAVSVVKEGMYAVVNESQGTARKAFVNTGFKKAGIKVYGKTGSTQGSKNAWFAGFFTDKSGRSLAMSVIVESGTSGAQDAAPLGREIIQLCINANLIGEQ